MLDQKFSEIYRSYYDILYRMAAKILVDHEEREDAIHTTFLNILTKNKEVLDSDYLKSYLCKSVIHTALNIKQKNANLTKHQAGILAVTPTTHFDRLLENDEKVKLVQHAIEEQLPPQCKIVFKKKIYEEKKLQEIADELQISLSTVKSHVAHAMRLLEAFLSKSDYFKFLLITFFLGYQLILFIFSFVI